MKKILAVLVLLVLVGWGGFACSNPNISGAQGLGAENAELKAKLDNIQDLVTRAKSDLSDVESEIQTYEPCEETNAGPNVSDVEDKLNEIESEASH